MPYSKDLDPYSYITAEEFFERLDANAGNEFQRIESVQLHEESTTHPICHHGGAFQTNNNKILIIDFVRPTSFRLRFSPDPQYSDINNIWDNNSCGLVSNTMKDLITVLDEFEDKEWKVDCYDKKAWDWIILESRPRKPISDYYMRIYVRKARFKIVAVQPIPVLDTRDDVYLREFAGPPIGEESARSQFDWYPEADSPPRHAKIVWQTKVNGILYSKMATVIEVHKPSMARYLGFGEQGGRQLLKSRVVLDYFNYDNMTYSQVHGRGPLDAREPLYHSEPFWMEIRQHPEHMLKVASFVDNFSQVCLDVGSKDNSAIRVACRFNSMRFYVIAEESVSKVINTYTLIVGRPQLKPRYVLGYHQGCYGYDSSAKIKAVVKRYRDEKFPLDGIHIDVDIQNNYRTFTVDKVKFPGNIFAELKDEYHVKCSTNITPFINADVDPTYSTLNSGKDGDQKTGTYFIKDRRFWEDREKPATREEVYIYYSGGRKEYVYPGQTVEQAPRNLYEPKDNTDLIDTYDKGEENPPELFRGGVWYGGNLGRPGYYPDLNRKVVRDWWGDQYDNLIRMGLEFVWQDMTSPCMGVCYGDMRSFPFRLKLFADTIKGVEENKLFDYPAIRIWSLYGLNLHRATFRGWDKHKDRENKRNLIIGRGGYIGLHRYAGLWTGDNSSDWDFLRVSVAQVLSLGLSGITISGGDVGGFEPSRDGGQWASPELLMRWYCAYSLLPWFR
ncbi:hypothetical protein FRC12_004341 [Ceratobasidium sp. 428]|nr:hypothetical protein FRC12_004341 [Ceratobasidium sp. 428]